MKLILIDTRASYSNDRTASVYVDGKEINFSVGETLLRRNLVVEKINVDENNPSIVFRNALFEKYTLTKNQVLSIDLNYSNKEPLGIEEVLESYGLPTKSILSTILEYKGSVIIDSTIDMKKLSNDINETLDYNATVTNVDEKLRIHIKSNK